MESHGFEAPPLLSEYGSCLNCQGIEFLDIFSTRKDAQPVPSILVQNAIANEALCRFCGLLASTGRRIIGRPFFVTERNGRELTFVFQRKWRTPVKDAADSVVSGGGSLSVRIEPPPSPFDIDGVVEFYLCPMYLDSPYLEVDAHGRSRPARFVLENEIDLSVCREWLRDCEKMHTSACREVSHFGSELPEPFRLVDVQDKCIVPDPEGYRYIALSYVWGQTETMCLTMENLKALQRPGTLSVDSLHNAKTIIDAMDVVRRMGERYLWVDRLCIVQNGPTKAEQLRCMDSIYGAALFTLVSADGPDANAGIKGVSPGSRSLPQHSEVVHDDLALTVSTTPPLDLAESAWSSRGWTCQEQLLSRRFLIFSGGQVMWQCDSCFMCEDTEAANKPGSLSPLERVRIDTTIAEFSFQSSNFFEPSHLHRPEIFSQYSSIVTGFTNRSLTFKDDVLRAFEGFGSILQRSFNCFFIAGLPGAYFDQALLWLPAVQQQRRVTSTRNCPSWSWSGWIGQSQYEDAYENRRERVVPIINWYVSNRDGSTHKLNEVGIGISEQTFGVERTLNTFLWLPLFELLAGRLDSPPAISHQPDTGPFLHFWSSCAFFRITSRPCPPDQRSASKNPPLTALINSPSGSGSYAGHLVLNESGPLELDLRCHELIVISEAQLAGFDAISSRYLPSERCDMWNVLLVEWDRKSGVAYRVGIGRVLKKAWQSARPVIKFVKLG